MVRIQTGMTRS